MFSPQVRAYRARWVFPVQSPPIRDGIVVVAQRRIAYVGSEPGDWRPEDLGNVAILPGLVNAHTHLEFSDLHAPLGHAGMPFTDWIATVIQHRQAQAAETHLGHSSAIRQGIMESHRQGVTLIGEIATCDWPVAAVSDLPVAGVVFRELLGTAPQRMDTQHQSACSHLECRSLGDGWRGGLSPHAPYSVHLELLARAVDLVQRTGAPLAMHLAESREEIELLASHRGPFVPLLERLHAWHPDAIPYGWRPMDYLQILARAPRVLIIHGNYLDDHEIDFLGAHADRMSAVFCPRTHRYFQHRRYPLQRMLAAGVRVALGTDSRASNPDLSVLAEMRQVARDYPEIDPTQILRMATMHAAQALGQDTGHGTLVAGIRADLALVALPDREGADPYELLLDAQTPVVATMHRGELVAGH